VKDVPLFPSLADDVRNGGKVPFILGIRVPATHMLKITAAVHTAVEVIEMIEVIPLQILVKTTQLFVMKDGALKHIVSHGYRPNCRL
jgi:hypothetical protein